jgi:hypothetical protein
MSDPWKHRSRGMVCETCMFFAEKHKESDSGETSGALGQLFDNGKFGRCRRRAPTMSGYPAVFGSDWCGEHKLDENKL